jgi:hypothetical protein
MAGERSFYTVLLFALGEFHRTPVSIDEFDVFLDAPGPQADH